MHKKFTLKGREKKKQEKNSRLLFGLPSTFCKLVITILALRNLFHCCNTQYCCPRTCTPANWCLSDTTPFCQLILLVFNMFVVIYEPATHQSSCCIFISDTSGHRPAAHTQRYVWDTSCLSH